MKYWVAVISYEHAAKAAAGGFLQVCHGKESPLRKTKAGDVFYIYCPREKMKDGLKMQLIAYRGQFKNDSVYQIEQMPGFTPYRKDVVIDNNFSPISLDEVRESLEWTANSNWGMMARRGFFEITQSDAATLMHQKRKAS